jgi:hypothetical protein
MSMPRADAELPKADRARVVAHADQLRELAARHGITELRFASPGRLVGHVADDRDAIDVSTFEVEAADLLGAEASLYSDAVLNKANVSPDLVDAEQL